MKKILFILPSVFCFIATDAIALNKTSHDEVELCITIDGKHVCGEAEEKEVYELVYNQKYDSYFNMAMTGFDKIGFDAAYFVDDIKKYTDCYAEAFAKEITIKDVNMIYDETTPKATRDAIINNIANKYVDKCQSKYAPYMDGNLENVMVAYIEKVCGSIKPSESVAKKCTEQYSAPEDIIKCQQENDEGYKCFINTMQELLKKSEENLK